MADDSDSEIEILSPSKFATAKSNTMDMDSMDEDGIQVTASTTTNPNIDFPHMRHSCGVHPFNINDASSTNKSNVINGSNKFNAKFCSKCYCFACDDLVSECKLWKAGHCHGHDKNEKWVLLREATLKQRGLDTKQPAASQQQQHGEVTAVNPYSRTPGRGMNQEVTSLIHNEFLSRLASTTGGSDNNNAAAMAKAAAELQRQQRTKERKDMRITEVLAENFQKAVNLHGGGNGSAQNAMLLDSDIENATSSTSILANQNETTSQPKMDGDIPPLSLHPSFFVLGVKIGWPFPQIMKPQRQMAMHLIKALKGRKHVVLESPTG
eukprot:CAMPEP_0172327316 /NCGR_PEP_ID=MMETSP1058-20130122/59229_1 /TAXON_ID=83371 /ORGANISM="Detonula confervacea, Strain CCMP 353" /LENGTH=322 /DNA_ID=CAMNT_0013044329 /DNA_START=105 /DNA_END=1070 /DNA_ORIENTATION=+